MYSTDISNKIMEKLEQIVEDRNELNMIVELLRTEKRYTHESGDTPHTVVKQDFQLLLDKYFKLPPKDSDNER